MMWDFSPKSSLLGSGLLLVACAGRFTARPDSRDDASAGHGGVSGDAVVAAGSNDTGGTAAGQHGIEAVGGAGMNGHAVSGSSFGGGGDPVHDHLSTSVASRSPPLSACAVDDTCDAGFTCFRLTRELAFCDLAQPHEASSCNTITCEDSLGGVTPRDSCGCGDQVCAGGKLCVRHTFAGSCAPPGQWNGCIEPRCSTPADCAAGEVCVPSMVLSENHCIQPSCAGDSDCTDGTNGRCVLAATIYSQAGELTNPRIECEYSP
jgi:hypothetical protein